MKPQVIGSAARVAHAVEGFFGAIRVGRSRRALPQLRIIPFRALGSNTALRVRGRIVWQVPPLTGRGSNGAYTTRAHFLSVYRSFGVEDVASVTVKVSTGSTSASGETDRGGYFNIDVPCPAGWAPGWHNATISCSLPECTTTATAEVFVPDKSSQLLIVSDLDDTAMDTETLRQWRMLRTVLFRHAGRRQPVPGVPALYNALHLGTGNAPNPVCYISSGAWNLYDSVLHYLDTHGMPRGAIFLNDWGSLRRQFHTVMHEHKSTHVADLVHRFPTLQLLLIGDDTQVDHELYAHAARSHVGRVAAIWIRAVHPDPARAARVHALREELAQDGTQLVYAQNTEAFEAHARERGWIL